MVRTEIELPDESYQQLKSMAEKRAVSVEKLLREWIDQQLAEEAVHREELWKRFFAAAGSCHDIEGKTDVAENHDKYLAEIWGNDDDHDDVR